MSSLLKTNINGIDGFLICDTSCKVCGKQINLNDGAFYAFPYPILCCVHYRCFSAIDFETTLKIYPHEQPIVNYIKKSLLNK